MGWAQQRQEQERAMLRRVTFDQSPTHRIYFRLLHEAFRSRGSAPADKRVSKDEMRLDAKISRAIKAISEAVGEEPKDGELDTRLIRTLHADGGVLDLEQPEFRRLQTYIQETQWMATMTDVAADLEDWLDTAEKVERQVEEAPEAVSKPRRVRA